MVVVHRMISGIDSFPLLAVPFFILAGNLMNNAGITNRIYNFALALVGWMKGGLGHVNIIGSVIFAGMSGTAIADAGGPRHDRDQGDARPRLPEGVLGRRHRGVGDAGADHPAVAAVRDLRRWWPTCRSASCSSPASCPALVMTVLMMLTVAYFAHKNNWGADIKFLWSRVGKARSSSAIVIAFPLVIWLAVLVGRQRRRLATGVALVALFAADWKWKFEAVLPIMTPVLLIGGMTTGLFTPTEGAVAASIWALFLGLVWYRTLTCKMLVKVSMETIETTATVLFIVAAASIFGWLLTATRVTDMVDGVGAGLHAHRRGCSCCSSTCCCCSSAASSSRPRRS